MSVNWKHVLTFVGPILVALGNCVEQHWSASSILMLGTVVSGAAGGAALPSVVPAVNIAAAEKAAAEAVLK